MKYIRRVLACLRKADEAYDLIEKGDRIVLGISGGKDSLCLLKAMSIYGLFSGKRFALYPVCLDLGFPGFDARAIADYCASLGLKLIVKDCHDVYEILKLHAKKGRLPCSICSRMKKAAINEAAHELKANKVAFAHHKDDCLETLLMNAIHGGRIASFEPKMHLERANITFIRPLLECFESDLSGMAKEEGLPVMGKICPNNGETEREFAKETLSTLYSLREEAHFNLGAALDNDEALNIPALHKEHYVNKKLTIRSLLLSELAIEYNAIKGLKPLQPNRLTYVFLDKKKVFGAVQFQVTGRMEMTVTLLSYKDNKEKEAIECFLFALHLEAKKKNPLTFVYQAANKKTARLAGFEEKLKLGKGRRLELTLIG